MAKSIKHTVASCSMHIDEHALLKAHAEHDGSTVSGFLLKAARAYMQVRTKRYNLVPTTTEKQTASVLTLVTKE